MEVELCTYLLLYAQKLGGRHGLNIANHRISNAMNKYASGL